MLPSSPPTAPRLSSSPGGDAVLDVRHLSKLFGATRAVADVSFSVRGGEIVGLLGPNGAGKTTTMKAVLGLVRPDAGSISVLGRDVLHDGVAAKRDVGYVPEAPALYEFLTGAEYLDFVADMYGLDPATRGGRIGQFLAGFELAGHEHSLISGYSQGMRQKVALTAAFVHRPRLLVLDEPLNGLDPRAARVVKDLLLDLARRERVGILFSTHVLEIAQAICERIVILHRGSVVAAGTVDELRTRAGLAGSGLEEVFLSLTETGDLSDLVHALAQ